MQVLDQTGSIAESAFRILRFILQCLIFLVAIAAARWGMRTFLLVPRRTVSALALLLFSHNPRCPCLTFPARDPADRLLTGVGDAIAPLAPSIRILAG